MNIEEIIDKIIGEVNDDWPTIYKIRYVYLALGKSLSKDTDFFFSAEEKLGRFNFNIEEMKEVYDSKEGRDLKVICRSSAFILQRALSKIGVKSRLIESKNNVTNFQGELDINHWLLAAEADGKTYFLTLSADLPYIQMGMQTKHFATDIPQYMTYNNGKVFKLYEGEEIKHTFLSDEELMDIDKKIGYVTNYYNYDSLGKKSKDYSLQYNDVSFYLIRDELKNNKLYYEIEGQETQFYQSLYSFNGAYDQKLSFDYVKLNELTQNDWNIWIKNLCIQVEDKIEELTGIFIDTNFNDPKWEYDNWIKNICEITQEYILLQANHGKITKFKDFYVNDSFVFSKWSRKIRQKFGAPKVGMDYDDVLSILGKTNALVNYSKGQGKISQFNGLLNSLAFHFINPEHIVNFEEDYITNNYIADKFNKVFPKLFSCNEITTDFNKMEYSEQIVIIKNILDLMFPELNQYNSSKMVDYNDKYNAVLNRIHMYPIKNKHDGVYSLVFNIIGDNQQGDYYFLYNPKKNTFEVANILQIYQNYIIVSERMKSRLEDLDDIDLSSKKK